MPLPSTYLGPSKVRNPRGLVVPLSDMYHFSLIDAAANVTNGYSTTFAGPNTTTLNATLNGSLVTAGEGRPDKPRNVVITVTHASAVVAESGTIYGFADAARRQAITEDWSVTAGGTSKTFTGAKSFAVVTRVTVTAASDASANSNIIGSGKVFGIPVKVSCPSAIKEMSGGSVVTNGTVVAGSSAAAADALGTYSPNAAPDGTTDFEAWVISDQPTRP